MNGIENAQHDINDAAFSIETALDLLTSLKGEEYTGSLELDEVIRCLREMQGGLVRSYDTLKRVNESRH